MTVSLYFHLAKRLASAFVKRVWNLSASWFFSLLFLIFVVPFLDNAINVIHIKHPGVRIVDGAAQLVAEHSPAMVVVLKADNERFMFAAERMNHRYRFIGLQHGQGSFQNQKPTVYEASRSKMLS